MEGRKGRKKGKEEREGRKGRKKRKERKEEKEGRKDGKNEGRTDRQTGGFRYCRVNVILFIGVKRGPRILPVPRSQGTMEQGREQKKERCEGKAEVGEGEGRDRGRDSLPVKHYSHGGNNTPGREKKGKK